MAQREISVAEFNNLQRRLLEYVVRNASPEETVDAILNDLDIAVAYPEQTVISMDEAHRLSFESTEGGDIEVGWANEDGGSWLSDSATFSIDAVVAAVDTHPDLSEAYRNKVWSDIQRLLALDAVNQFGPNVRTTWEDLGQAVLRGK